jgi:hypothetical protein
LRLSLRTCLIRLEVIESLEGHSPLSPLQWLPLMPHLRRFHVDNGVASGTGLFEKAQLQQPWKKCPKAGVRDGCSG